MQLADQVKPISYLKSEAAQIVKDLTGSGEPLMIAQNGEAKLVVQDVRSSESIQQTLALLKMLALGHKHIERGNHVDGDDFFAELNENDQQERLR